MIVKLARFGVVGAAMTVLNYLIFIALIQCGAGYAVAAVIAWSGTAGAGYGLNRRFTFRRAGWGWGRDMAAYVACGILQLSASLVGLRVLIGYLHLDASIAFIANLVMTTSISFCCLHWGVFRATQLPA